MSVRTLSRCALLSGAAVVILLLANLTPSGWLGVTALAGGCTALACGVLGTGAGVSVWLVSSLLSFLLLPRKEIALLFALVFGLYGVFKGLIQKMRRPLWQEWGLKLLAANVQMGAAWMALRTVLVSGLNLPVWMVWLGANLLFVCYDLAFTRALGPVLNRLGKGQ